MAYTAVPTLTEGREITAAWWNTYVRDNFAAGVPDIMTAKGDLAAGTGASAGAVLALGSDAEYLSAASTAANGVEWAIWGNTIARYKSASTDADTIANATATIVDYSVSVYDPGSAVTTGASWNYSAPADGYYLCAASVDFKDMASTVSVGDEIELRCYLDSAYIALVDIEPIMEPPAGDLADYGVYLSGVAIVKATSGQTIDFRTYQNTGGTVLNDPDTEYHCAIARIA